MKRLALSPILVTTLVLSLPSTGVGGTIPRLAGDFEKLWTVPSGPSFLEGPAYDGAGSIWFTDLKDGSPETPTTILRHDIASGAARVMVNDSGGANGLEFDHQGRLLAALWHEPGSLTRRSVNDLTNVIVLAHTFGGRELVSPDDLVVDDDGGIYFTDSGGLGAYYINPFGDLTYVAMGTTNGVALSPNGDTLYLTQGNRIVHFQVADDGSLTNRRTFAAPIRDPDGLTVDRFGNLYAGTFEVFTPGAQVQVWNSAGDEVLAFEPPEGAINLTFAPGDMLYFTTQESLYRVPITFVPEPSGIVIAAAMIGGLFMTSRYRHLCR